MNTATELSDWRISALEKDLEKAHREIEELRDRFDKIEEKRQAEERNRLKWGIATLGGMVMSLLGLIWTFRKVIIGGESP